MAMDIRDIIDILNEDDARLPPEFASLDAKDHDIVLSLIDAGSAVRDMQPRVLDMSIRHYQKVLIVMFLLYKQQDLLLNWLEEQCASTWKAKYAKRSPVRYDVVQHVYRVAHMTLAPATLKGVDAFVAAMARVYPSLLRTVLHQRVDILHSPHSPAQMQPAAREAIVAESKDWIKEFLDIDLRSEHEATWLQFNHIDTSSPDPDDDRFLYGGPCLSEDLQVQLLRDRVKQLQGELQECRRRPAGPAAAPPPLAPPLPGAPRASGAPPPPAPPLPGLGWKPLPTAAAPPPSKPAAAAEPAAVPKKPRKPAGVPDVNQNLINEIAKRLEERKLRAEALEKQAAESSADSNSNSSFVSFLTPTTSGGSSGTLSPVTPSSPRLGATLRAPVRDIAPPAKKAPTKSATMLQIERLMEENKRLKDALDMATKAKSLKATTSVPVSAPAPAPVLVGLNNAVADRADRADRLVWLDLERRAGTSSSKRR